MLTPKQAQKLLRLICIPSNNSRDVEVAEDGSNHKRVIARILDNLDEWNLRISAVDLKLMYHQVIFFCDFAMFTYFITALFL